jgi:hypothetical protein
MGALTSCLLPRMRVPSATMDCDVMGALISCLLASMNVPSATVVCDVMGALTSCLLARMRVPSATMDCECRVQQYLRLKINSSLVDAVSGSNWEYGGCIAELSHWWYRPNLRNVDTLAYCYTALLLNSSKGKNPHTFFLSLLSYLAQHSFPFAPPAGHAVLAGEGREGGAGSRLSLPLPRSILAVTVLY